MRYRFVVIFGLFTWTAPGCFMHTGYPNGYYGPNPSVVPQQPSTGYPGGPAYPPGNPIYQPPNGTYPAPINGGSPYTPGTSPGNGTPTPIFSPTEPGTPPTYDSPAGGGSPPPFNPSAPTGGKVVPPPNDDDDPNRYSPQGSKGPLTPTTSAKESEESTPFAESSGLSRDFLEEPVVETDQNFVAPVVQTSGTDDGEVRSANHSMPAATARSAREIYGHDPDFEWVQGVVEFDEISKTWLIMYNDKPRKSDQLGGELTIADDPLLVRLRNGDVVRCEGTLDPNERDGRDKPLFRITSLRKL
jgi:hypothetical protein